MLIFADHFKSLLSNFRLCVISGRYGAYKTALAVRLAVDYFNDGYRVFSNFDLSINSYDQSASRVRFGRVFIVLDEAAQFVSQLKHPSTLAMLRKTDCVIVVPTVVPVSFSVPYIRVDRVFDFNLVSIPIVSYRYSVVIKGKTDKNKLPRGYFYWWRPSEVFGMYKSSDVLLDDADIINRYKRHLADLKIEGIAPGDFVANAADNVNNQ